MNHLLKRSLQIGSLTALATLAPVQLSLDEGVTERRACAQSGTCCPEKESLCIIGGQFARDYYFKAEGPCRNIE